MATGANAPLTGARHHKLVSNICSNWATNIVGAIVGFLLAPVMVHRLGDAGYGIWAFGMQLTTYLAVLDFGIRASVGRFLTFHHTRGEKDEINGIMSVALTLLSGLAIVCIVISFFVALWLDRMVKIPAGMLHDARWTVLLVSWMVAISLPGTLFAGAIASLSRYEVLNSRYIIGTIIRAALTWVVLVKGGAMLAVSLVWFLVTVAAIACDVIIASWLYGGFEYHLGWKKYPGLAKKLFAFSFYAFLLGISSRLVLWSDNVVIAMVLGPVAVTFYAIGANLIDVARNTLASMTMVFVPLATSYEAQGESSAIRRLLVRGSRIGLLIIIPVLIAFFIVGKDFIALWMGVRYVRIAGTVLVVLTVPVLFAALQGTSNQILYGVNRHQLYAVMAVIEALVNLGLSIVLAYKVGVVGVAIGTMVPAVIVEGIIVPIYAARVVGQSAFALYRRAWFEPIALSLPYAVWLLVLHQAGWSKSWSGFVFTIAAGLVIYAVTLWGMALSADERKIWIGRLKHRIQPAGVVTSSLS